MPNMCYNELTVSGKTEDINDFLDKNIGYPSFTDGSYTPHFCFNAFLPLDVEPEHFRNIDAISRWGTKWDIYYENLTKETIGYIYGNTELVITFDTAWNPPIVWFEAIVKHFKMLSFALHYEEPGMRFAGDARGICGEFSLDEYDDDRVDNLFAEYDMED